MHNIVAIIGRPNVGKSTLFNRLTQSREAIVDEFSGVTRDRHYNQVDWSGSEFTLIDTGGYVIGSKDIFQKAIQEQVKVAVEEADLLLFVLDVTTGITVLDSQIYNFIKKTNKPTIFIANKVDNHLRQSEIHEFYKLGNIEHLFGISSISGSGTGELLDCIISLLDHKPVEASDSDIPKIAIVGRPNVGKSSLINVLVGENRNIVTEIAGTTRDAITMRYNSFGLIFDIIDTAGIRKKRKVTEDLEFYSVVRTIKAIDQSDVCILMIEANQPIASQDLNIMSTILQKRKGFIIVVNKWDLVEDKVTNTMKEAQQNILRKTAPFTDIPIIFTSIINNKQRVFKALQTAIEVYKNRKRKISTSKLNDFFLELIKKNPPPAIKGKWVKIKYVTQLVTTAPTFAFFCNLPQYIKEPYKRFLENNLRQKFNFTGVPIKLFMRKK